MKSLIFLFTSLTFIVPFVMMSLVVSSDNEDYYKCITAIFKDIPIVTDVTKIYLNRSNIHLKYSNTVMSIVSRESAVYLANFVNIKAKNMHFLVDEHWCMVTVNIDTDLQYILKKLYRVVVHTKCIIFLTYKHSNMIQHLTEVARQIWISGLQRNILFVATSDDRNINNKVVVYSSPSYATGICTTIQLIEAGYCESGKIFKHTGHWFPNANNLGNCKIHAIVYPPFPPYVQNRSNDPNGLVGSFMEQMSKIMNFSVMYSWPTEWIDFVNHTQISELNIAFDLAPLVGLPLTNSIFRVAKVNVGFVAEISEKIPVWRRLDDPLDKETWMIILIMLFFIAAFGFLSGSCDISGLMLKVIGILAGVGTSRFPSGLSWDIFNWTFQLPALFLQEVYLAALTNNLTVSVNVPYFSKLDDLVKNNYTIFCHDLSRKYMKYRKGTMAYLAEICIPNNLTNYYDNILPSIIQSRRLNKTSLVLSSDFILANNLSNIYLVEYTVYTKSVRGHRGVLFISEMENIWIRLNEGGISNFFNGIYVNNVPKNTHDYSDDVQDKLMGSIELLLYGYLVGFVVLIMEIFINRIGWRSMYQHVVCTWTNFSMFRKKKKINIHRPVCNR